MFNNILVLYDFSKPSHEALKWAVSMASHLKANLKVMHVFALKESPVMGSHTIELQNQIESKLEKITTSLVKSKTQKPRSIRIEVPSGDPVTVIRQTIKKEKPDLVILATHGRTGLKHFLLGSVAEKVVRYSESPVWVVRGQRRWAPKKILVPVDFMEFTSKSLTLAKGLAKAFGAALELIHVVQIPDLFAAIPEAGLSWDITLLDDLEKQSAKHLKEVINKNKDVKITAVTTVGPTADEICKQARKSKADLILVPTHARSGVEHLFLGSVTESIVRYAPTHVLTFHPTKQR